MVKKKEVKFWNEGIQEIVKLRKNKKTKIMKTERQIEFDKASLVKIQNAIDETNKELDNALKSIHRLVERIGELKADERDYEIRIAVRSNCLTQEDK